MSKDDYRNASFITSSFDQDFPIPELIGPTEILSEDHRYTSIFYWENDFYFGFLSTEKNFAVIYQLEPKDIRGL